MFTEQMLMFFKSLECRKLFRAWRTCLTELLHCDSTQGAQWLVYIMRSTEIQNYFFLCFESHIFSWCMVWWIRCYTACSNSNNFVFEHKDKLCWEHSSIFQNFYKKNTPIVVFLLEFQVLSSFLSLVSPSSLCTFWSSKSIGEVQLFSSLVVWKMFLSRNGSRLWFLDGHSKKLLFIFKSLWKARYGYCSLLQT